MSDELKKFLSRELEEIKQNKIRIAAMIVFLVIGVIFWISDNSSRGEEIDLSEPTVDTPPVTPDLPVRVLPVAKSIDGVTIVMGASADALIVADPFDGREKPKPPPKPVQVTPPIPQPVEPVTIQPPIAPPPPQEKIVLTGTAITGEVKTAMFLRGKETLFLTVGEEIGGRRIIDITPDSVTFEDGEVLTIGN